MNLGKSAAAAGFRLIDLAETPSTNDEARMLAEAGDPGAVWIVAGEQKAGRGRHGRTWASPPGNLYASLLLVRPCEPSLAPQLGFVAGLAIHDAISDITRLEPGRLALKWPNDLLLDGAKVAGLLLEGVTTRSGNLAVVVGMGVNIRHAPDGTPYPATALAAVAPDLEPSRLFRALSDAMAARLAAWSGGQGFADIRHAWLARAAGLNAQVTVRLPGGAKTGLFNGIDASGRLELSHEGRIEHIDAGDLFFGSAASEPNPGKQV